MCFIKRGSVTNLLVCTLAHLQIFIVSQFSNKSCEEEYFQLKNKDRYEDPLKLKNRFSYFWIFIFLQFKRKNHKNRKICFENFTNKWGLFNCPHLSLFFILKHSSLEILFKNKETLKICKYASVQMRKFFTLPFNDQFIN